MYLIVVTLLLAYIYLLGNMFTHKFNINPLISGFILFYGLLLIPSLLVYANFINFNVFCIILVVIISLSILYMIYMYLIKRVKFNKFSIHVVFASIIWIAIYLMNTNFSILSANGFDDYFYIGHQNQLINNLIHPFSRNYRMTTTIEGWVYINAAISKIFSLDVSIFNRFVMSIVNIVITVSIFDSCLSVFNNKYSKWYAYVSLILIVFPIISYEYWFGSVSRLIYRPFYGSSLSTLAVPLLLIYVFEKVRKEQLSKLVLIVLSLIIIFMIHILNVLFIGFFIVIYWILEIKNKWIVYSIPFIVSLLIWTILKIVDPSLLTIKSSNSVFEYWNIMYDLTRWAFVIIYMLALTMFIIKDYRKKIEKIIMIFSPIFIFILFFTSLKNLSFNLFYGFGMQRFISQLLGLICIYLFANILNIQTKLLRNFVITISLIVGALFTTQTSLYTSITQQVSAFQKNNDELKFTNISRNSETITNILKQIPKNSRVLTQPWVNIKYNNDINHIHYYGYVAHSLCSFSLYSSMSAQSKDGLIFQSSNVLDTKGVAKEIKNYKINYVLISEYYRAPNDFVCHENLNYLYNNFAQHYIIKGQKIPINKVVRSETFIKLKKEFPNYKVIKIKNYQSNFGNLYLIKVK